MIYIVEIPHQHQPFCWSAIDEDDAVFAIRQVTAKMDNTPALDAKFITWIRYNAQDLYSQYVFMDAASAIDGIKLITGHNAVPAIAALLKEIEANGELPEELDHDR
jgi:hypothetical protein